MQKTHAQNPDTNRRLPHWLKQDIRETDEARHVKRLIKEKQVHTVCQEAGCPNIAVCFRRFTATFLILGNVCTRHCRFCGVAKDTPRSLDPMEPMHVAEAVQELGLKHAVITSVTRDDLPDGGAAHYAETVRQIRMRLHDVKVEVLIPDFQGNRNAIQTVLDSGVDVLNHNVETVPRLYPEIRPEADFQQSLHLLSYAKTAQHDMFTKSGFMLGLGETEEEVIALLECLSRHRCDAITIGQYLPPSRNHHPVQEYVSPEYFEKLKQVAFDMGFISVQSGPLVRSSFHAEETVRQLEGAS